MGRRHRYTLRLVEVLALVAATALGLATARSYLAVMGSSANLAQDVERASAPFAVILSTSLFVVRLRIGRAGRRRLCRQPGFVATAAVVTTVAV
jgi:hypothetical protein